MTEPMKEQVERLTTRHAQDDDGCVICGPAPCDVRYLLDAYEERGREVERLRAEVEQWRDTARAEMAGRRSAEAVLINADQPNTTVEAPPFVTLSAEIERLRANRGPGNLSEALDVAQHDLRQAEARLRVVVEAAGIYLQLLRDHGFTKTSGYIVACMGTAEERLFAALAAAQPEEKPHPDYPYNHPDDCEPAQPEEPKP